MPRAPPSPPAGWRSIRPWNRLTLHVREITPVSATFILSSSIGLRTWDDADDCDDSDHAGPSQPRHPLKALSMSELLGKGLAVKVNNSPWQRVVMHIDDDVDSEAIVILYGLHPARTYDIELALVAGEETIRGKISTDAASDDEEIVMDDGFEDDFPIMPTATAQAMTPAATRPTTPTPPDPPRPMTVEERASQLLHELTALDAEKESLGLRLKAARKESQRADAALRSEIEALKRASERSAQTDHRSRQKILALQEATKQSLAASVEADEQVKLVEASLPPLEARARSVELEYARIKEKSTRDHAIASEAIKSDKKQVGDLEAELLALNHRLERLTARKDKLVTDTVPDLESELAELGRQIEEAERRGLQTPPEFDHLDSLPHFTSLRSQLTTPQSANSRASYPLGLNPLASPQDTASRSLPPLSTSVNPIPPQHSPITSTSASANRVLV